MSIFIGFLPGSLPIALLSLLLASCGYNNSPDDAAADDPYDDGSGGGAQSPVCGELEEALIDTDEALEVEPGVGAGAFIEYAAGGAYRISTSCDVAQGGPCTWDILLTPLDGASIESIAPSGLEQGDDSLTTDGTTVQLLAYTEDDLDGFTLQTAPGAAIRFDALLDGACANRYLFWVGDGALHSGAPSNPIDLVPTSD